MSHKKKKDFVSYTRLLKYAKPYKWRLTIGILSGLIASGSLFGGLMMLPQLMKGVDLASPETIRENQQAAVKIVNVLEKNPTLTTSEKTKEVTSILISPEQSKKSDLKRSVDKINKRLSILPDSSTQV